MSIGYERNSAANRNSTAGAYRTLEAQLLIVVNQHVAANAAAAAAVIVVFQRVANPQVALPTVIARNRVAAIVFRCK